MPVHPLQCDVNLLRRSLADELSDREEEALAGHLEQCPSCQRQLAELAAGDPTWQRIGAVLKDESHAGLEGRVRSCDETDWLPSPGRRDYASSPVDFAVDFLAPPTTPDSLGRLGDIDIVQVIGQGGMGIVLKGLQRSLNRAVAVKVLAPHLASSGPARQRFAREAQAAAVIMHANVMPIFSVDAEAKLPYLVMPFVDCESLQQRVDRTGALETIDVLRIGMQVARGLAAAHAQGLVHRDVKPANILLEHGVQRALLTDFGLARAADDASLTRTGLIAGTPQYMSPEQARGEAIDSRSDLFSLGSVLYTACAGRPPFRADSSYGILRRITDTEPRSIRELNPTTPAWLTRLIERLMSKRPGDRFDNATRVGDLLEQCLAYCQQPQAARLPGELGATANVARRLPLVVLALAAVSVLCVTWPRFFPPAATTEPPAASQAVADASPNGKTIEPFDAISIVQPEVTADEMSPLLSDDAPRDDASRDGASALADTSDATVGEDDAEMSSAVEELKDVPFEIPELQVLGDELQELQSVIDAFGEESSFR